jgi:membrane protein required for colicin V production
MTIFDYVVLAAMALSVLLGAWRGVVNELLALVAWVAAFLVARIEAPQATHWLAGQIAEPGLRLAAAFIIIFVGVLILFAIARMLLSRLLSAVGLGTLDRLLGAVFGVLRGLAVMMLVLVFLPKLLPVDQDPWWQQSLLIPRFLRFEGAARQLVSALFGFFQQWL